MEDARNKRTRPIEFLKFIYKKINGSCVNLVFEYGLRKNQIRISWNKKSKTIP